MAEIKKPQPATPGNLDYAEKQPFRESVRDTVVPVHRPGADKGVRINEVTNTHKAPAPPPPKSK
jgi:hypothetical protein